MANPRSGAGGRGQSPLPRSFYLDSPDVVARKLLGKLVIRRGRLPPGAAAARGLAMDRTYAAGRIVEAEAYFGDADPAAHAFIGKTPRNAVLFGRPGHAYVYLIYGMHFCLNVACEPEGRAGSVLIRALEPVAGLTGGAALTSGPGRLCRALGVTRERDNGADLTSIRSALQIRDDGFDAGEVLITPRIGIRHAADRLARFALAGNPYVSRPGKQSFAVSA